LKISQLLPGVLITLEMIFEEKATVRTTVGDFKPEIAENIKLLCKFEAINRAKTVWKVVVNLNSTKL